MNCLIQTLLPATPPHVQQARQCREQRIERPRIAAQEAADDHGAIDAAAIEARRRARFADARRRGLRVRALRQLRRVGSARREAARAAARRRTPCRPSTRACPARSTSRAHRRGRLGDPRRNAFDVIEDRASQPDRAQKLRKRIGAHARVDVDVPPGTSNGPKADSRARFDDARTIANGASKRQSPRRQAPAPFLHSARSKK